VINDRSGPDRPVAAGHDNRSGSRAEPDRAHRHLPRAGISVGQDSGADIFWCRCMALMARPASGGPWQRYTFPDDFLQAIEGAQRARAFRGGPPAVVNGNLVRPARKALPGGRLLFWYSAFEDSIARRACNTDDGRPAMTLLRGDGSVEMTKFLSSNQLHDPGDGRPAMTWYHPDGSVECVQHLSRNQLHDPGDGRPAMTWYRPDGSLSSTAHYRKGRPSDVDAGGVEAAFRWFDRLGDLELAEASSGEILVTTSSVSAAA